MRLLRAIGFAVMLLVAWAFISVFEVFYNIPMMKSVYWLACLVMFCVYMKRKGNEDDGCE